jgi:cobalt transporter subunit CbtB
LSALLAAPTITPNMLNKLYNYQNSGDVALIEDVDSVTTSAAEPLETPIYLVYLGVSTDVSSRLVADEPHNRRRMTSFLLASKALVLSSSIPTLPGSSTKQENSVQRSLCDSLVPAPIALSNRAGVIFEALLAMSLGASMVGVVGFSHIGVVHNAARRTRHSNAFPSH